MLCIGIQDIHLCSSAWVEEKPRQKSSRFFYSLLKSSGGACLWAGHSVPLFCFAWVRPCSPHYMIVRIQRYSFKILIVGLKEEINQCLQWDFLRGDLWTCLACAVGLLWQPSLASSGAASQRFFFPEFRLKCVLIPREFGVIPGTWDFPSGGWLSLL